MAKTKHTKPRKPTPELRFGTGHRKHLFSVPEACHALAIKPTTLYGLIGAGRLDAVKIGDRTLITENAIVAFLERLPKAKIKPQRPAA
jgi:excisionase family DNA binding protein